MKLVRCMCPIVTGRSSLSSKNAGSIKHGAFAHSGKASANICVTGVTGVWSGMDLRQKNPAFSATARNRDAIAVLPAFCRIAGRSSKLAAGRANTPTIRNCSCISPGNPAILTLNLDVSGLGGRGGSPNLRPPLSINASDVITLDRRTQ